jgi:class 3 adenylate cyclase
LFCDLVNSTAVASRLDPEEWHNLAAKFQTTAADAVTRLGGHVAKYLGDGVMAYLGWPEAHDNDAERTARFSRFSMKFQSLSRLQVYCRRLEFGIYSGVVVVAAGARQRAHI